MTGSDVLEALREQGVRIVRVTYPDLHGVLRGKDVPIDVFASTVARDGLAFCKAISTVDLRHNVVAGFEHGFRDIHVTPLLDTLARVPWDMDVAWCLSDQTADGEPYGADPRAALKRAIEGFSELGLNPVMGPELEFYLLQPCTTTPSGWTRYVENPTHVYTVGAHTDPRGVLDRMLLQIADAGLGAIGAAHEYGMSQWEINLTHSAALDAADRAFRFKAAVKDIATQQGLLATFMGKPFNGDAGSGFHLHLSLCDENGVNAFADTAGDEGCAEALRHFIAGVLAHAPALMAFLNPTVNAYRRIDPHELVPTRACWGYDNRFGLVRVPPERGGATRVEMRLADGSANPYLATAALLFAGLDGIRRELTPPAAVAGLVYELPEDEQGDPIPLSLAAAVEALEADATLRDAMGASLVDTFLTIKRFELERYNRHVSDWDLAEYAHHL
ncbi:MAG: glutamine synthetase [Gaiellales bacterium]|jgi:glutamine synthetase|nr:glutamine synthetase [Gaiellales bacterium]